MADIVRLGKEEEEAPQGQRQQWLCLQGKGGRGGDGGGGGGEEGEEHTSIVSLIDCAILSASFTIANLAGSISSKMY